MVVWYIPVIKAERLAEQTGEVVQAFVKRAPCAASLSRLGVLTSGWP
jgi:hypothetical protein